MAKFFLLEPLEGLRLLRLGSEDGTNRLTRACVLALAAELRELECDRRPLVVTGNARFFSSGADLNEIAALIAPEAYESPNWDKG